MGQKAILDVEMGFDEGTRYAALSRDEFLVFGCAALAGDVIAEVDTAIRGRGVPKWRDANVDDARFMVDLFRRRYGFGVILIVQKDGPTSREFASTVNGLLVEDHERMQNVDATLGGPTHDYPINVDLYLRSAAYSRIFGFREVIRHYAVTKNCRRHGPTLMVDVYVYFDRDNTSKDLIDGLQRKSSGLIEAHQHVEHEGWRMAARCKLRAFEMQPEHAKPSLLLVDYLNGIVAASEIEKYQHARISRDEVQRLRRQLEEYGQRDHTFSIMRATIGELTKGAVKSGDEAQRNYKALSEQKSGD